MKFSSRHLFAACVISSVTTLWALGWMHRRQDDAQSVHILKIADEAVATALVDLFERSMRPRIVWHTAPKGGVLG